MRYLTLAILSWMLCITQTSEAKMHGKVDFGPAVIKSDIIHNGEVVNSLDLYGAAVNGTISIYKAFCIKPSIAYAEGDGKVQSFGLGAGAYIPLKKWSLLPYGGFSFSKLEFDTDFPLMMTTFKSHQRFLTRSPYVGLDIGYKFSKKFGVSVTGQYAWAKTSTTIDINPLLTTLNTKTESRGINAAVMFDYYLNDHWSINLTGISNKSQSKEKDGSKLQALRLGVGYRF